MKLARQAAESMRDHARVARALGKEAGGIIVREGDVFAVFVPLRNDSDTPGWRYEASPYELVRALRSLDADLSTVNLATFHSHVDGSTSLSGLSGSDVKLLGMSGLDYHFLDVHGELSVYARGIVGDGATHRVETNRLDLEIID